MSFIVLWTLLSPGYILTLDMVFTPYMDSLVPERAKLDDILYGFKFTWNSGVLPFLYILKGTTQLIDSWVLQKVLLFLILLISGFSAHSLCPTKFLAGKFFAGLMYMLNPFVYTRFMVGHWLILLAYAVTPFAVKTMINLLEHKRFKDSVKLALLLTLVSVFSAHILFLNLLIFLLFTLIKLIRVGDRLNLTKQLALTFLIYILLNLYWIIPSLTEETILTQVGYEDIQAFTSKVWGSGFNIVFTLASLHGFWRPPEGYLYIYNILPTWYLIYLFLLSLSIFGFVMWIDNKCVGNYVLGLGIAATVSLILASGISSPYFSPIFKTLFNNVPFFKGFREPQKFVAILALAYSYLGGLGVSEIAGRIGKRGKLFKRAPYLALTALIVTSPIAYSFNMLFGFNGQLKAVDYPKEWYEANNFLKYQSGDFKILFLPWHLYMRFSWTNRTIANPASSFFQRTVIAGENIEVGNIETQSTEPVQQYIHFLLKNRHRITNLGELLAPLNIKYIVLAKTADYADYQFLYNQTDLRLILDNPEMSVFENLHSTAKIYWVKGVVSVTAWEEFIELSEKNELTNYVYVMGGNFTNKEEPSFDTVNYTQISPVEYKIEAKGEGYIILTEPYSEAWNLQDRKPISNLGLVNAFHVDKEGCYTIYFTKFRILLTYYIVSLTTLVACIALLTRTELKSDRKQVNYTKNITQ